MGFIHTTELSEFFGPHRVPGRELSEFLSAYGKRGLKPILAEVAAMRIFCRTYIVSILKQSCFISLKERTFDEAGGGGQHLRRRDDNKHEIRAFDGGGLGGRRGNRPKTLYFLRNAMTI